MPVIQRFECEVCKEEFSISRDTVLLTRTSKQFDQWEVSQGVSSWTHRTVCLQCAADIAKAYNERED